MSWSVTVPRHGLSDGIKVPTLWSMIELPILVNKNNRYAVRLEF